MKYLITFAPPLFPNINLTGMKHREAKFNVATQTGTFSDKVHHGEMKRNAKLNNDAPTSRGQNLAGDKGIAGARTILAGRFKKA